MKEFSENSLGRLIQRTLRTGVGLCALFFALGFAFRLSGSASAGFFLRTGAVLLIMTPVARVAMLVYGFIRTGEYRFAAVSAGVLALLFVSVLL